jgi:hypothetical protein
MTLELFEFELFEAELKYRHDAELLKLDMSEYRKHINYSYLKRYSTDEHIAHANISHRRRAELDERRRIYGYNTHDEEETLFYHAEKFYRKTRLLRKSDRSDIYPGHQILDYDYIFMPFAIKPIMDDTEDGTPVVGVRLPKNKNEYDWVTVTLDDNPKWIGDNVNAVHNLRKKSKHFAEALDFTLDVIKETKETLIEHRTDKISGSEVADFINDCIKRRIYAGEYPNVKITEKMKSLWDPE